MTGKLDDGATGWRVVKFGGVMMIATKQAAPSPRFLWKRASHLVHVQLETAGIAYGSSN